MSLYTPVSLSGRLGPGEMHRPPLCSISPPSQISKYFLSEVPGRTCACPSSRCRGGLRRHAACMAGSIVLRASASRCCLSVTFSSLIRVASVPSSGGRCSLNHSCSRASLAVIRLLASYVKILFRRSRNRARKRLFLAGIISCASCQRGVKLIWDPVILTSRGFMPLTNLLDARVVSGAG